MIADTTLLSYAKYFGMCLSMLIIVYTSMAAFGYRLKHAKCTEWFK